MTGASGEFALQASREWALWKQDYVRGASKEVYAEFFSPSFYGLTFAEAVAYVVTGYVSSIMCNVLCFTICIGIV